ncbi:MAG: hypothetical protein ACTSWK_00350 [Promethearchaeota archaeon]
MSDTPRKSGKKNRKFGRAGRRPSHKRYNTEKRWEKNKARKQAKHKSVLEKKAARKAKKE